LYRAGVRGGGPLHAVPWRSRHHDRNADRTHVATVAQLHDHRRTGRSHARLARPRGVRPLRMRTGVQTLPFCSQLKRPTEDIAMLIRAIVVTLLALAAAGVALAQEQYPARTIKIVVPTNPGAVTDVLARSVGQALSQSWGQPVVVDNRPGADETLGVD